MFMEVTMVWHGGQTLVLPLWSELRGSFSPPLLTIHVQVKEGRGEAHTTGYQGKLNMG